VLLPAQMPGANLMVIFYLHGSPRLRSRRKPRPSRSDSQRMTPEDCRAIMLTLLRFNPVSELSRLFYDR
jgi:hypothetical protein